MLPTTRQQQWPRSLTSTNMGVWAGVRPPGGLSSGHMQSGARQAVGLQLYQSGPMAARGGGGFLLEGNVRLAGGHGAGGWAMGADKTVRQLRTDHANRFKNTSRLPINCGRAVQDSGEKDAIKGWHHMTSEGALLRYSASPDATPTAATRRRSRAFILAQV